MNILALNGGSSTIKAALFAKAPDGSLQRIESWNVARAVGIEHVSHAIEEAPQLIAHRIVHGADHFAVATELTDEVMVSLRKLEPLAPLHQPFNLELVEEARRQWPEARQIGCFDTAFHQTQSDLQRRYALPRELHDRGIKHYGFHGLSYAYVSNALFAREPALREGRVVIAHLGSGASACAVKCGVSVATSMGFSPLDGLVMSTRCGGLDPGVILHLLREGMDVPTLETLLYKESGLLGVSGSSGDLQTLLRSDEWQAEQAVELFVRRCCEVIAGLAAAMQGIDALVFTGGIGEHQAETRAYIVQRLAWLGAELDSKRNEEHSWCISSNQLNNSGMKVFVVPTDEEQEMVKQAFNV
ncbi:MAG TPA: acetate/propionate family kinase [Pseudomonadales bacterium]|nr:acetate/propionate family kinase [Pseudomonadales bacterium]